MDAKVSMGTI